MKKLLLASVVLIGAVSASRAGVRFDVGINIDGPPPLIISHPANSYDSGSYGYPAPVYSPAPVCEPPVVVTPPPVVFTPPVVCTPQYGHGYSAYSRDYGRSDHGRYYGRTYAYGNRGGWDRSRGYGHGNRGGWDRGRR